MIVTCPNCSARYKVPEAKLKGRGAKITCPNCSHRFTVQGDDEAAGPAVPADLARRDFRKVGIHWKVRKGLGLTYDFNDLATLKDYLDDGQVDKNDVLSWDTRDWRPLKTLPDLDAHFWDVWQRAEAGEIKSPQTVEEDDREDESDAPTTIVGQGTSLADEIRKAVHEASTPAPAPARAAPTPIPISKPNISGGPRSAAAKPPAPPVAPPEPKKPEDPFQKLQQQKDSGSNVGLVVGGAVVVLVLILAALWLLGVFG